MSDRKLFLFGVKMKKDIKKTVRFSEDEFKLIEVKLKENNLDFASLVREALLKQKIKFPLNSIISM